MLFEVDHFTQPGWARTLDFTSCQDAALSGIVKDRDGQHKAAYALWSDGCGSGGATEHGAEAMIGGGRRAILKGNPTAQSLQTYQLIAAGSDMATKALTEDDMLATGGVLYVNPTGRSFAAIDGDGFAAWRTRGGDVFALISEWAKLAGAKDSDSSAPCYPWYAMSNYADFIDAHGGDLKAKKRKMTIHRLWEGGSEIVDELDLALGEALGYFTFEFDTETLLAEVEYLIGGTDFHEQVQGMDSLQPIFEAISFRSGGKNFVRRRASRFLARENGAKANLDDAGLAGIQLIAQ